jgi:N-acetyl-gamma-glutamyl-phosphate reductase
MPEPLRKRVGLLHGAGYAGGEIIRILLNHPAFELTRVTSRSFAGEPVWRAHAALQGQTDLSFTEDIDYGALDALIITAEHGQGVQAVIRALDAGYENAIVDLSADFRFEDESIYPEWFGFRHPAPKLLSQFAYGLSEVNAPYEGKTWIANPGCFASGLALALYPLADPLVPLSAAMTALTGASGSGARPKPTTHYPTREGNVRAYKPLAHQHLPEVQMVLGPEAEVSFVPVSGPWVRGIWGTAHVSLPAGVNFEDVSNWYRSAYRQKPLIRLSPGTLPELRASVNTPFCDIGWVVREQQLIVTFALDNLLKGAASQAVQNLNLIFDLPETAGLLPQSG